MFYLLLKTLLPFLIFCFQNNLSAQDSEGRELWTVKVNGTVSRDNIWLKGL